MDKDYTVLMLIVDQSGSMMSIREESQQALDDLIKNQKEQPGKLGIKLITFNHRVACSGLVDSESFTGVVLEPEGMTAMHDAIGIGIKSLSNEIDNLVVDGQMPGKVIVVTITDGFENSSREHNSESIKKMIEAYKRVEGWEFIFLGANQDAITTAKSLGINAGSTMTYVASPRGVAESIAATARYIADTRSGIETEFTDEERNKSGLT